MKNGIIVLVFTVLLLTLNAQEMSLSERREYILNRLDSVPKNLNLPKMNNTPFLFWEENQDSLYSVSVENKPSIKSQEVHGKNVFFFDFNSQTYIITDTIHKYPLHQNEMVRYVDIYKVKIN